MTRTSGIDSMTVAQRDHWKNQPRDPKGTETGGQWTDIGSPQERTNQLSGDDSKWFSATNKDMNKIAKQWAKKYTLKQLRAFQASYLDYMKKATGDSWKAMQNRWQAVTWAIDFKEFGD